MAAGRTWVAASMPRCQGTRCWRIDAVTLADDGVVFTRVASNPDASTVMRRAFTESGPDLRRPPARAGAFVSRSALLRARPRVVPLGLRTSQALTDFVSRESARPARGLRGRPLVRVEQPRLPLRSRRSQPRP